ncbi:endolytic transglycosylase MltG [Synechocystis sp. PCC 7509]|uniref:endolytic transglycosylase MltG n=1 Tax=Synechocystis sp. PCC 7509 TaxID=927677 RepID=UPI0002ABA904|nr:endolytic transglycosylase MltG [Synechocystis sp. PCC 7509]
MKVMQKAFKWSLLLLLPALGVGTWLGWNWWNGATSPTPNNRVTSIQVKPGTPAQQIGQQLEAAGVIRSSQAWSLWARYLQKQEPKGGFKAGNYLIAPNQPLSVVAEQIWNGKVVELSFTIPEGWSLRQMGEYFEKQGFFSAQEFLAAARKIPRNEYSWLPVNLPHLEGFLYPDTYKLNGDSVTPAIVVRQMLNQFQVVALPVYQAGKSKTDLDLLEWVTLGSIVEKEAVIPQERSRIAGVFASRLRQGMLLQTDPTVEYALNIRQTKEQPLTFAQIKVASPYNTYVFPGLPPTPIASPGIASLKAALNPEKTAYLYFVARYDGTHVFSKTLSEHTAAQVAIRKQVSAN